MCGMILDKASIQIRDSSGNVIDTAKEETLQEVKLVLQDVAKEETLQEVAKETTLQDIKAKTDKLQFDANNNLNTVLRNAYDSTNDLIKTAIQGSVAYENIGGYDFFKHILLGQRYKNLLVYTVNLGANSTYTSASWNLQNGAENAYSRIVGFARQVGSTATTVKIQQSPDNSTWYDIATYDISSSQQAIEVKVYMPYVRVVESNTSSSAQTSNLVVLNAVPL